MLTGDLSGPIVHTLKSTILDQLSRAIYGGRCTLQYQFLRLLQILSSLSAPPRRAHHRSASTNEKPSNADEEAFELKLAQVIIQGVSSESNRPVLQHWVDFVLTIAPTLHLKQAQLYSICESFSLQVRSTVLDLRKGFTDENPRGRGVTDAEVVLLLTGLERLLALCGQVHASQKVEESRGTNEVGSGILGLVSGVFIAETPDEKAGHLTTLVKLMPAQESESGVPRDCAGGFAPGVDGDFVACTCPEYDVEPKPIVRYRRKPESPSTGEDVQDADRRRYCWMYLHMGISPRRGHRRGDL